MPIPSLFKYMRAEHADSFFRDGTLRVGTLHDFRRIERHGTQVGDEQEGIGVHEMNFGRDVVITTADGTSETKFFNRYFGQTGKTVAAGVHLSLPKGVVIRGEERFPNCYLYCCSTSFNADTMRDFGCDTCIKIFDPESFFAQISLALRDSATFEIARAVTYASRTVNFDQELPDHPAMIKDPRYASQFEFRAVWRPHMADPRPLIAHVPGAITYCAQYVA